MSITTAQGRTTCELSLLHLPLEVKTLIVKHAGHSSWLKLCLVCTRLCNIAQPILFEEVHIKTPSAARSLVCARGPGFAQSTARLLANHTEGLALYGVSACLTEYTKTERAAHRFHMLMILGSCNGGRLNLLEIKAVGDPNIQSEQDFQMNIALVLRLSDIQCSYVVLESCARFLVGEILQIMGDTLEEIHWDRGFPGTHEETFETPRVTDLPYLKHIYFGWIDPHNLKDTWLRDLLETTAPRLRRLALAFDDVLHGTLKWSLAPGKFKNLEYFRCDAVPFTLCSSILNGASTLLEMSLGYLQEVEENSLSVIPSSVTRFDADSLRLWGEPLHTLLGQMERFTSLVAFPQLR